MPVEIDREVEEVGDEGDRGAVPRQARRLEDVQALDNEDIRRFNHLLLARHHVVDEVGIDRGGDAPMPGLDVGEEAQQGRAVVALGKTLPLHRAHTLQFGVGVEEAVGRDEIDLRRVGPAGEQRLQHPRRGRFADRHRAGQADNVGHLGVVVGEQEALRRLEQPLGCRNIEREQAGERKVDRHDLLDRDRVVERLKAADILGAQRQRGVGT